MKSAFAQSVALLVLLCSRSTALAAEAEVYPWSETSPTVRVPKRLVMQLDVHPVTMTNNDAREFVVTENFAQLFCLTPGEVRQVNTSLSAALHDYRMEESKHFAPTDKEPVSPQPPGRAQNPDGSVKEEKFSYYFTLTPFPKEALAIRKKLDEGILKILGEQRAEFFLRRFDPFGGSAKRTFQKSPDPAQEVTETITHKFELKAANPTTVDFYEIITTEGFGGRGHSSAGWPYGPSLDQYAPEAMKPVLARWRKLIAENAAKQGGNSGLLEPPAVPQSVASQAEVFDSDSGGGRWDDRAPFVDLPKSLIQSLNLPGLTLDEEISPEAAVIFGLNDDTRGAVRELYQSMKDRFEQLESAHFQHVKPGENTFVLRPFPKEAAALRAEWRKKLQELVGTDRGQRLARVLQNSSTVGARMHAARRFEGLMPRHKRHLLAGTATGWLLRGTEEIRVEVTPGVKRGGEPTLDIKWRGEQGGNGSVSGTLENLPEPWRHLLPPDILGIPLTL